MFRKILVALDGSELAERALNPALALAQAKRGKITLLRVPVAERVMIPVAAGYELPWSEQDIEHYVNQCREYLGSIEAAWAHSKIQFRSCVISGNVAEVIIDTAAEEKADVIVMSSHGYSGVTRWIYGSVAENVLRGAPCPVLVVRTDAPIRKVLIPLDGSELSERALIPACELAAAHEAEATLLRVVQEIDADMHRYLDQQEHGLGLRMHEEMMEEARLYLQHLLERNPSLPCPVETAVWTGPIAPAILEYSEFNKIDVIAMSTHGRTGLQRWVYGSVTEKVLRSGSGSMLIVRPPAHELKQSNTA